MADLNPTISIITLNVNGLNISINNQRLSNYILKHLAICYLQENFRFKEMKLKVKSWKKVYNANRKRA